MFIVVVMNILKLENDIVEDLGYLSKASIVSIIAVLAGFYHDIFVFKYATSLLYYTLTFLSIGAFIFIAKDKSPQRKQIRPLFFICLITSYVVAKTYFVSYIYAIASIEAALLVAMFLNFDLKKYIIINVVLFVATILAIEYHGDQGPVTVITGNEVKYVVLQFYVSLHLFIILLYSLAAYPKIKAIKAEKSFSELGKSTSFLLHELARPIQKLQNHLELKDHNFLEELTDTLELAKILRNKDYHNITLDSFDIASLYRETMKDYTSYIQYFEIKFQEDVPHSLYIRGNAKFTKLIVSNLIRNAIEALKELPNTEERIMSLVINPQHFCLTNTCLKKVDCSKIFDAGYTTKKGNMGVGLYLTNNLCEKIGWKLAIKTPTNNKSATFSISLLYS